jgi:tetratricopeptide (TPR) repeat protein
MYRKIARPLLTLVVIMLSGCGPRGAQDYNEGVEHYNNGRLKDAVAALERALALNERFAEAHHSLGVVLIQLAELDRAESSFQRAEQLLTEGATVATHDHKSLPQKRALVARHRGLIEERRYAQFREVDGERALDHLRLAREHYRAACQLDPDDTQIKQALSKLETFFERHQLDRD